MQRIALLMALPICLSAQANAPDALLKEGLSLARASHLDESERLLRHAAIEYPNDKRFPIELAGVLYREKKRPQAQHFLRAALRLDPTEAYASEFLGTLYLLDGNLDEALKYWNRLDKPLIQNLTFPDPPALDPVLTARAVSLSGGQIFTLQRLWQTEANLDRLDIFSAYHFDLTAHNDPSNDQRYDVAVRLDSVSQPFGGWIGVVLPYLRELPFQTVDIDRYNIRGQAINFTSLWRWDANKRRIGMDLSGPLGLDPRYLYRFVVDARDERWNLAGTYRGAVLENLGLRRIAGGGDLVIGLTAKLQWTSGIRVVRRWFANTDANPVFDSAWSFEPKSRLDYRLIDWPEHRVKVDASGALDTGRLLAAGKSSYSRTGGDLSAVWFPQRSGDAWEVDGRLRAARTFGSTPFDEYYQLGMERDNELGFRGIEGTRDGLKGSAPLGVNYALAQTELQRTLFHAPFITLNAGPFFDTGRISGPSAQFGSNGWVNATGIQARIKTIDRLSLSLVYGRDLRSGQGVFYSAVTRGGN